MRYRRYFQHAITAAAYVLSLGGGAQACRPSDVLSVPAPVGVQTSGSLQSTEGAESAFNGAKGQFFVAADGVFFNGLLGASSELSDEFTYSDFMYGAAAYAAIDARITAGSAELGDSPWLLLLQARSSLLLALPGLTTYEVGSGRSRIGEAYALMGYAELLIAESYCAGTTLSQVIPGGGIQYGNPLTTDSLLGTANADFNAALAAAYGNDTVAALAHVGLGRGLLDRAQYSAADTAVASVPSSFVYNDVLEPGDYSSGSPYSFNLYDDGFYNGDALINVADREGSNGLNFLSAHDARLTFDSSVTTPDGGPWYLPTKFEANFALIPLATGIEARLIEAEDALQAQQTSAWVADLNQMRNSGCTATGADTVCGIGAVQVPGQASGLASLSDPGTDSGRVSLMFRERAFWLFGTGTRLGDLRRLIRQYGRDPSVVFPVGPYPNGHNVNLPTPIPDYGTDVNLTLPTQAGLFARGLTISNPNYKGCITSTKTA